MKKPVLNEIENVLSLEKFPGNPDFFSRYYQIAQYYNLWLRQWIYYLVNVRA